MSIKEPSPSTQAGEQATEPEGPASGASFPKFDERLTRLLDEAAARIRASRTEIERAATYVETARQLLAGGQTPAQPHIYSLPPYLSPAPSRWFVSSRSHRRARAAVLSRRHTPRRPPAPGSSLPCTRTGCPGTMKFGGDPGDTPKRRRRPMLNAAGSAAREPGTLTCRIRDPPARSRSLSSPARGGKTTGGAGRRPGQALRPCLYTFLHSRPCRTTDSGYASGATT